MVLILEQWRKIIPSLYSKIEVVNFTKIEIYNPSALKYYSQFVNIYQFHYLKYNHVKGGSRQEDSNTMESYLSLERHFRDYFLLHRGDIATWATPLDPRLHVLKDPHDKQYTNNFMFSNPLWKFPSSDRFWINTLLTIKTTFNTMLRFENLFRH